MTYLEQAPSSPGYATREEIQKALAACAADIDTHRETGIRARLRRLLRGRNWGEYFREGEKEAIQQARTALIAGVDLETAAERFRGNARFHLELKAEAESSSEAARQNGMSSGYRYAARLCGYDWRWD